MGALMNQRLVHVCTSRIGPGEEGPTHRACLVAAPHPQSRRCRLAAAGSRKDGIKALLLSRRALPCEPWKESAVRISGVAAMCGQMRERLRDAARACPAKVETDFASGHATKQRLRS